MDIVDSDCSICLQQFVHPVELPCGHIFCFLCIKGCAQHRRRCPMCRGRFSLRFFEDPKLVNVIQASGSTVTSARAALVHTLSEVPPGGPVASEVPSVSTKSVSPSSDYRWFYEGFAGWWQYDDRTSEELESAFSKQLTSCDVQVAGFIYTIDFVNMTQKRQDNSGRKRRIKRDLKDCPKKGIAGIKLSSIGDCATTTSTGNTVASSSSRQVQPNQSCTEPIQPERCTASSLPPVTAQEQLLSQASSLSLASAYSDSCHTHTNPCPTHSVRHTPHTRRGRSRTVAVSDRNASPTGRSPSPTPAVVVPHDSPGRARNDCLRLPGSRTSRSVPRRQ